MTTVDLVKRGFKRIRLDDDYWFELKIGKHKFLTNDTGYNKGKDKWHVGYYHGKEDFVWFDNQINSPFKFDLLFLAIIGKSAENILAEKVKKRLKKATVLKTTQS